MKKTFGKNTWGFLMLRNGAWTYAKSGIAGKGSR